MAIDYQRILSALDHTQLRPTAVWEDIRKTCDEAMEYGAASVCIPASYVRDANNYLEGRVPVCTVIGFPHGNCTTGTKLFEAKTAIMDGASEIDMVINLGYLKDERYDKIFSEVSGIKAMVGDKSLLKVIVETGLLTEEEKIRMCVLVAQTGADFIKTSTGFNKGGATPEDIRLFAMHSAGTSLRIKAAGGISSLEDAQHLLDLGASRIGSSRIIQLLQEQGVTGADIQPQ